MIPRLDEYLDALEVQFAQFYPDWPKVLGEGFDIRRAIQHKLLVLLDRCNREDIPPKHWAAFLAFVYYDAVAEKAEKEALMVEASSLSGSASVRSTTVQNTRVEFGASPRDQALATKLSFSNDAGKKAEEIRSNLVRRMRKLPVSQNVRRVDPLD